ncbi:hypothetical protein DL768_001481 [Monosporascus sp. mg162]|nr:hypothetical protein DL768_001481 [Monosporascus sp. mg162]
MANQPHSPLRFSVHVSTVIPCVDYLNNVKEGHTWSPISCTLVYSDSEAVLVITPITIDQTKDLIAWIEKVAPGRKLSYIYVTHGHADHFLGVPQLVERFPEAVVLASRGTIYQIYKPLPNVDTFTPLPDNYEFKLQGRWTFRAIEVGHSDTHDSTVLWVPDLKLAICGAVVYGEVHQNLFEANTKAKREEWIRAVERVEALKPAYVVAGHRRPEDPDAAFHLAYTKKYLMDWGNLLKKSPSEPKELIDAMMKLYPNRFNPMVLFWGARGAFQVPESAGV